MTTPNISINPALTSNALGSFNVTVTGLIQGTAYPDPETRYALSAGTLLSSETIPMFGGVAIFEQVPGAAGGVSAILGSPVGRSTTVTGGSKPITAFAVFDQGYGAINSPQSPVQQVASGGQVMYYRLGTKARIAVAADPSLISLRGGLVNANVSWDFVNQQLIPYSAPSFSAGSYTTPNVTLTTAAPHGLAPGDQIIVSGVTGTGADLAKANGQFTLIAGRGQPHGCAVDQAGDEPVDAPGRPGVRRVAGPRDAGLPRPGRHRRDPGGTRATPARLSFRPLNNRWPPAEQRTPSWQGDGC